MVTSASMRRVEAVVVLSMLLAIGTLLYIGLRAAALSEHVSVLAAVSATAVIAGLVARMACGGGYGGGT